MINSVNKINDLLDSDEKILASLKCSMHVFIYTKVARPGILTLTNKRLLFYGFALAGEDLNESFALKDISYIHQKKVLLKEYLVIRMKDNEVFNFSNITSDNVDKFIDAVNKEIKQ